MTVKEIMAEYFKAHPELDGLCNEYECGCGLDDFGPCDGEEMWECQTARRVKDEDGFDIYVPAEPEKGETDAKSVE